MFIKQNQQTWSVDQFLDLKPYIRNRAVEGRIKKKKNELEMGWLETHRQVTVGRCVKPFKNYKVGDLFRLDGNTRSAVWELYPHLRPLDNYVTVFIIDLGDEDIADRTYYSIDSSTSYEKSNEKNSGYLRELNYTPVSKKIRDGKFSTSVADATRFLKTINGKKEKDAKDFDRLVHVWEEFTFIDKFNVDKIKTYSSNLFACLIIIARKYGTDNPRFLKMLENLRYELSEQNDKQYVDGVTHIFVNLYYNNPKIWGGTGWKKQSTLISEILYSMDCFMNNVPIKKRRSYVIVKNEKLINFFMMYQD